MSRCLATRGIDHVVLERGSVANTWKTERWDSLTLLTPNWQSRLPDYRYDGDDPDGYMTMPEVISFIEGYADAISAPLHTNTTVTALRRSDDGFVVETDQGEWRAPTVVVASGHGNIAHIPAVAAVVPPGITQITPSQYRTPGQLEEGGVLVVGAAATGIQLADEIQRSGRQVTVAVGGHVRAPRVYRGMDIQWWMDVTGLNDELYTDVDDVMRVRRLPSFQLAGTRDRRTIDLNALTDIGVNLVGKFAGVSEEGKAQFSGSLRNQCALADLKLGRLLDTIDEWGSENAVDREIEPPHRLEPTRVDDDPPLMVDLTKGRFQTIIWATGFRPDYSWLDIPVVDEKGYIRHDGGVVDEAPGMYVMGMPFLRRRKSTLIDGAADDANDLGDHLATYLDGRSTHSLPNSRG
jgi:putative flavoprotein involved in K+ transport